MKTMNKSWFSIVATVFFCLIVRSSAVALEKQSGIILADNTGTILYQQNADQHYIPASILKILTSLVVLEKLGENYRFKTDFYYNSTSNDLYIKGMGDPFFISESIQRFCNHVLSIYNLKTINHIIIDQTYFSEDITIPGTSTTLNPYDANVGALCANFNTIYFKYDNQKGFVSAEPQTPLLPIYQTDLKASGLNEGRIILNKEKSQVYPGHLIQYFLKQQGIAITGKVLTGKYPYHSPIKKQSYFSPYTTMDVCQKLLKYSNNFVANQLLLAMGAMEYGSPATMEKGLKVLNTFCSNRLDLKDIILSEGSGISRDNKLTPKQMMKILIVFKPYYRLLKKEKDYYFKTGTLSNVRTIAGYFYLDKKLYPHVIMKNRTNSGYNDIMIELKKLRIKILYLK